MIKVVVEPFEVFFCFCFCFTDIVNESVHEILVLIAYARSECLEERTLLSVSTEK